MSRCELTAWVMTNFPLQVGNFATLELARAQPCRESYHLAVAQVLLLNFLRTVSRLPPMLVDGQEHILERLHSHEQVVDNELDVVAAIAVPNERDERHAIEATQWMVAGKDEAPLAGDVVVAHCLIGHVEVGKCHIGCVYPLLVAHVVENLVEPVLVNGALKPSYQPLGDVAVVTRQTLPNHAVNIDVKWLCFHAPKFVLTYKDRYN